MANWLFGQAGLISNHFLDSTANHDWDQFGLIPSGISEWF